MTAFPDLSRPEDILRFWRAVEFSSPPPVPGVDPAVRTEPVERVGSSSALPWETAHRWTNRRRPEGMSSRFTLYCGVYRLGQVSELLESAFGKDAESADERQGGESCLFAVLVTSEGRPLLDSIILSSAA